jgi:hypothetical protein
MQQGLIYRIGTGENTHEWNQNWIPGDHMLRPIACRKPHPPPMVSDFISTDSMSWNKPALQEWFLPMDVEDICKIPLSARRHDDIWAWHYNRSGLLSVKSVYRLLITTKKRREDWLDGRSNGSNSARDEKQWKNLWKVQVPSKLRSFLWRLARQSLPTGDVRHHWYMADTSKCSICGAPDSW